MLSLSKKQIAVVALIVALSFVSGWYFGTGRVSSGGATASLVPVENCQGSSCSPDKFFFLSNVFNTDKSKPQNVDFSPFWKTWQILNDRFVNGTAAINSTSTKKATEQERVWGAISGMVSSLGDPYTVFMPPVEKTRFEEDIRGNFSGVGMEIGMKDGVPTVIAPLPDSPAKKAGILSGDKVLKVDGATTMDVPLDEVIRRIRGKEGTAVILNLLHEKERDPVDIRVVRAVINIPTLDQKTIAGKSDTDKVYVISLYNFSAQSSDLFRNAIQAFSRTGGNKLVLDLRGNPGGYLDAAVDMASWFLPQGKVVVQESYGTGKVTRIYSSSGYDIFKGKKLKMVVLVDRGSASASEILAGARAEHGVAKLIGEKTFGKGSVQELVPITENSSLKITIARWLTPAGKSISQNGLDPEILVKNAASSTPQNDIIMNQALKYLRGY
ncbi:MAG: S41 family peptidase [Candidatus Vogelbacteria bacterium]|nr:S41 family peptidase [Candidatus Vogelbacteria bacterium]